MLIKKLLGFTMAILTSSGFAFQAFELHQAPLNRLDAFSWAQGTRAMNVLQKQTTQTTSWGRITRYQQFYKNIPLIGAQVTISQQLLAQNPSKVNGFVVRRH